MGKKQRKRGERTKGSKVSKGCKKKVGQSREWKKGKGGNGREERKKEDRKGKR
jgi:hypothetical protein